MLDEQRATTSCWCWNLSEYRVLKEQKRLLIPPVYSLRGIRAYDELQIVVTEVGKVKPTVTVHIAEPGYKLMKGNEYFVLI